MVIVIIMMALLDSMVASFVLKFPRGVVLYRIGIGIGNWNWLWSWWCGGVWPYISQEWYQSLTKVQQAMCQSNTKFQFKGTHWDGSECILWNRHTCLMNKDSIHYPIPIPSGFQNQDTDCSHGPIQYLIPIQGYPCRKINCDIHTCWRNMDPI